MNDIRRQLGQRVRALRTAQGWSQEQLAEKAGLHHTYLGGIERAERNVSLENIAKLASAFQISLKDLFHFVPGDGSEREQLEAEIVLLIRRQSTPKARAMLSLLETLEQWPPESSE